MIQHTDRIPGRLSRVGRSLTSGPGSELKRIPQTPSEPAHHASHSQTKFGSERESVKCPIWRGLERLRPAAGCRLARQSLYSEPQIQRWRPVLWGRTFHASRRSWKESSHPIDSSWLGTPARLIAGTLGGTGIPHRVPWLGRSVPTKAAGIPWLPNGENPSIPRRLKNPECCHQTRPLSPETLRPGRPSLASQSTRTRPFKPEPNERTSLYSFLRRATFPKPCSSGPEWPTA